MKEKQCSFCNGNGYFEYWDSEYGTQTSVCKFCCKTEKKTETVHPYIFVRVNRELIDKLARKAGLK